VREEEYVGKEGIFSEEGNYLAGDLPIHAISQAKKYALEGISKAKPMRFEAVELENADVFVDVTMPRPQLIIVGGVHISIPLVTMAKLMGYYTVIVDPRKAFCNEERFPHADKLIPKFAKQAFEEVPITTSSAIAVLTHDPKIDDDALICALNSPAFYIGGLGSKRTQALRRERLMKAGFTEEQLQRIKGPIGIDILARTPEEIALSIMAEIVLVRNQQ
jgi:xanthine dehydrogenase accessory factor